MSSDAQLELYRQGRTAQDKYVYFMLAAAGACIAFAVTKTQDAGLSWKHAILGIAVLCWAASFYAGATHLRYVSTSLVANLELLKVEAGEHPRVGQHNGMMAAASEGIREALEENSSRTAFFARAQTGLLLTGAIFYLVWHVMEMYLRAKL